MKQIPRKRKEKEKKRRLNAGSIRRNEKQWMNKGPSITVVEPHEDIRQKESTMRLRRTWHRSRLPPQFAHVLHREIAGVSGSVRPGDTSNPDGAVDHQGGFQDILLWFF